MSEVDVKAASRTALPGNAAEWTTFLVSCLVVVVLVGMMVIQLFEPFEQPAPVARQVGAVRMESGRYFVAVDVTNHGDRTASDVQVSAELTVDGVATTGDQVIDFLAGDEVEHITFSFDDDPEDGEFTVRVASYSEP